MRMNGIFKINFQELFAKVISGGQKSSLEMKELIDNTVKPVLDGHSKIDQTKV